MGQAIWTLVSTWGDFSGLVIMQFALSALAAMAYHRLRQRIDDKGPDELREGGGSWVRAEALRRDLDVRVLVAPTVSGSVDAYMPSARTCALPTIRPGPAAPQEWPPGHQRPVASARACAR